MSLRVTFVRHAQSEANRGGLWQGQGDSVLSDEGREQAKRLGERLSARRFDLVVASDLVRAAETAAAVGPRVEVDRSWREMDLGSWEGRTFEEVRLHHPDLLEAIRRGEAVAFGETGETVADFEQRAVSAFQALCERAGEGEVLVVTHGGVIDALVGAVLGRVPGRRTFPIATNTSLTVFEGGPGEMRLASFNDATHLGIDVGFLGRMRDEGIPVAGFLRHGLTKANREGRIQGQSCWGLDPEGVEQARAFARWYGSVDRVVSSPLPRALETARSIAGETPVEEEVLVKEMAFGGWEGRIFRSLLESDDDLARRVYQEGEDLPRGGSGESFAMVVERLGRFLEVFEVAADLRTLVVSHGAAIRALVASVTSHPRIWETLATPGNTSVTHLAFTPEGPVLADYAVAPHLEAG